MEVFPVFLDFGLDKFQTRGARREALLLFLTYISTLKIHSGQDGFHFSEKK